MSSRAEQLLELGQSVWLDFIRRGHLRSGEFERLVRDQGVVGVTSNPTIFQLAIAEQRGLRRGADRRASRRPGSTAPDLFEALAIEDIQMACDLLAPVDGAPTASTGESASR